jgi:hypothetical protein
VADFRQHGDEPSGSIKKEFFYELSDNSSNNILHHGVSE